MAASRMQRAFEPRPSEQGIWEDVEEFEQEIDKTQEKGEEEEDDEEDDDLQKTLNDPLTSGESSLV